MKDDRLWQEYGLSKLRINSLKSAIPKEWKYFFMNNELASLSPLPPHNYDLSITLYKTNFARKVYAYIAEDAFYYKISI